MYLDLTIKINCHCPKGSFMRDTSLIWVLPYSLTIWSHWPLQFIPEWIIIKEQPAYKDYLSTDSVFICYHMGGQYKQGGLFKVSQ